jgi:hypothetical protein
MHLYSGHLASAISCGMTAVGNLLMVENSLGCALKRKEPLAENT